MCVLGEIMCVYNGMGSRFMELDSPRHMLLNLCVSQSAIRFIDYILYVSFYSGGECISFS